MQCLSEETVQSFVQGELTGEAEAELHEHCGTCSGCRRLVAEVARVVFEDTGEGFSRGDEQQTIGRYVILEPIGEGGSSIVYAASDPDLGRKVALKLLRSGPSASGEVARRRMLREGRAMALLSHPNVVTVYDVGTWRGQVFVAMELVVGQTLKEWQSTKQPTRRRVLEVYLAAGRGLAAAHAAGLVHRDFKPENVLVGEDGRVCVTDFGLARAAGISVEPSVDLAPDADSATVRARTALATLTQTGSIVGTPAYMAPEQFAGEATDARTDQFSFCVALHEALYGRRPFEGDSLEDLIVNVFRGGSALPLERTDRDALAATIARGLDTDPQRRHPSMDALLGILERELSAPAPIAATPPRRRARFAIAVALLGIAGAVTLYRRGAAFEPPAVEQPIEAASMAPYVPALSQAAVEPPLLSSDPLAQAPAAGSALAPGPAAKARQARRALRRPSPRRGVTPATSATAPSPGRGAGEDDGLITDPWRSP